MNLKVQVRFESRQDAAKFWEVAVSHVGMKLFKGFGMVPGIVDVQTNPDGTNRIINSDGSFHRERILEKSDQKFTIEMDQFQGPVAKLFLRFREYWSLEPDGQTITRIFEVIPKNLPSAVIIHVVLRPQLNFAMKKNITAIARHVNVTAV